MNLKDKVAIVTGASAGLGVDFSRVLIEKGAHVYGFARSEDKLQEVQQELGALFHPLIVDVRVEDEVDRGVKQVLDEQGRVDVLVNNAGLGQFGNVDELAVSQWDLQMETNLRGVFLCTRAVLSAMKAQNADSGFGGHIVNIASVAGLVGNPRIAAYNATKFGLRGFSEALMKEVRDDGIKVTCIYPGSVATNFSAFAGSAGSPNPMQSIDVARTMLHVVETRRIISSPRL